MAVTASTRLGITRWSAGTDPLTRLQLDGDHSTLDNLVAIDLQGTLAARPAFGVRGRYYYATDTALVYRDTGTAWVTVGSLPGTIGGAIDIGDAAADGTASTYARSDHQHAFTAPASAPPNTDAAVAAVGTATTPARSDHKHSVNTAAPPASGAGAIDIGDAATIGTATTLARSDHQHAFAAPGAAYVTAADASAAADGTATTPARSDHRHNVPTAAPPASGAGAIDIGDTAAVGTATTLARSDHQHAFAAPAAGYPVDVDAGAEADGTASTPARSDHKHTVATAAPTATNAIGDAAAAGTATTLARSDHQHSFPAPAAASPSIEIGDAAVIGTATTPARSDHQHAFAAPAAGYPVDVDAGAEADGTASTPARSDHKHTVSTAAPTATNAIGDAAAIGTATTLARSDHQHSFPAPAAGYPVDVDAGAEADGTATTPARSDHKHTVSTAAPGAVTVGATASAGTATTLARSDHVHSFAAASMHLLRRTITSITAATTLTNANDVVIAGGTTAYTVTLPAVESGKFLDIKRTSTGVITVSRAGTALIDGATTFVLNNQYDAVTLVSDGTNWHVL